MWKPPPSRINPTLCGYWRLARQVPLSGLGGWLAVLSGLLDHSHKAAWVVCGAATASAPCACRPCTLPAPAHLQLAPALQTCHEAHTLLHCRHWLLAGATPSSL